MVLGARTAMWGGKRLPYKARLEYIESDGSGQYIDTGFIPNLESKAEVQFAYIAYSSVVHAAAIFGERGASAVDRAFCVASGGGIQPNTVLEVQFDGAKGNVQAVYPDFNKHTWVFSKDGGYYDGILTTSVGQGSFTGYGSCWIFGRNSPSPSTTAGKIYEISLWQDNELVRDLIPVLDNNDVPCMYDDVSGEFFYNAGSGTFTAGPVVGGGYKRKCVRRSHRRSSRASARFWHAPLWKEAA